LRKKDHENEKKQKLFYLTKHRRYFTERYSLGVLSMSWMHLTSIFSLQSFRLKMISN